MIRWISLLLLAPTLAFGAPVGPPNSGGSFTPSTDLSANPTTATNGTVGLTLAQQFAKMPNLEDKTLLGTSSDITSLFISAESGVTTNGTLYIAPGTLNIPALSGIGTVNTPIVCNASPVPSTGKLIVASGNGFYGAASTPFVGYCFDTVKTFSNSQDIEERDNTFHGQGSMSVLKETVNHLNATGGANPSIQKIDLELGTAANPWGTTSAPALDSYNGQQVVVNLYGVGNASPVGSQVTAKRQANSTMKLYARNEVIEDDNDWNSNSAQGITGDEIDCRRRRLDNGGASSAATYAGFGSATGYSGKPSGTGIAPCLNIVLKQAVTGALPLDQTNPAEIGTVIEETWSNSGSTGSTATIMAKYGFLVALPIENSAFDCTYSYLFVGAGCLSRGRNQPDFYDEDGTGLHSLQYSTTAFGTTGGWQFGGDDGSGNPMINLTLLDGGQINVPNAIGAPGNVTSVSLSVKGDYLVSSGTAFAAPTLTFSAAPGGGTTALGHSLVGPISSQTVSVSAGGDQVFVGEVLTPASGTCLHRPSFVVDTIGTSTGTDPDTGNPVGPAGTVHISAPGQCSAPPISPFNMNQGNGAVQLSVSHYYVTAIAFDNNGGAGYLSSAPPTITFSDAITPTTAPVAVASGVSDTVKLVSNTTTLTPPAGDTSTLVSNDAWVSLYFIPKTTSQTTPPAATVTGGGSATVTGTDTGMEVTVTGAATTTAVTFNVSHTARPKACTGSATNGSSAASVGIRSITNTGFSAQATIASGGVLELICQF